MEESSGLIPRGELVDKTVFSEIHANENEGERERERERGRREKDEKEAKRHK